MRNCRAGVVGSPQARFPGWFRIRFLRAPFKPCVRFSRTRLTDGLLMPHSRFPDSELSPRLRQDVTPVDSVVQRMEASLRAALGSDEESALELSYFIDRVVGPLGHALALTPSRRRDQSRAPFLGRGYGPRRRRYYGPLGLPPGTIPFHRRLIGTAVARRRPPGRVSPVPHRAVVTCPPPYPGGVLHPSDAVRHDPVAARGYWDPRGPLRCSLLPSP